MTGTKKFLASVLAVLMVLMVLPVASFAAEVAYQANEAKELKRWDDIWAVLDPVEAEMMAAVMAKMTIPKPWKAILKLWK